MGREGGGGEAGGKKAGWGGRGEEGGGGEAGEFLGWGTEEVGGSPETAR